MPKPKVLAPSNSVRSEGNADAIWRNRALVAEHDPEVVLVLSTVVTSEAPEEDASRQAVVEVDGDGRLSGFPYKPDEPPTTRVGTEVGPGGRFGGEEAS
jgi:glucose-1-phosphate adenylyltransferase